MKTINTIKQIFKEIEVLGAKTLALIDTGSDLNLYRHSFQLLMKDVKAVDSKVILNGLAGAIFHNEQKFSADLEVNRSIFTIEVYSVSDKDILCDFIVGRTLFQTSAELKINPGVVEIN